MYQSFQKSLPLIINVDPDLHEILGKLWETPIRFVICPTKIYTTKNKSKFYLHVDARHLERTESVIGVKHLTNDRCVEVADLNTSLKLWFIIIQLLSLLFMVLYAQVQHCIKVCPYPRLHDSKHWTISKVSILVGYYPGVLYQSVVCMFMFCVR